MVHHRPWRFSYHFIIIAIILYKLLLSISESSVSKPSSFGHKNFNLFLNPKSINRQKMLLNFLLEENKYNKNYSSSVKSISSSSSKLSTSVNKKLEHLHNNEFFVPLDWLEFLIPLKLLHWPYFTIIVGTHTENSVKNSTSWNWSLKMWEKFFVLMKEHYEADIEMAEMTKLFSSEVRKTSINNSTTKIPMNPHHHHHDCDEPYSSNHFICFVQPAEFLLLISKVPCFLSKSWLFLSKPSSTENETLHSWRTTLNQFSIDLDSEIYIGILNEALHTYTIYEVYRICSSCPLRISIFCTLVADNGLQGELCTTDKYQRRQNLQGMYIKAVAVSVNPFDVNVTKRLASDTNSWKVSGGLYAEIFSIIANEMNIRYDTAILDGYKFGKFNSTTRTWDGMIGMVNQGQVDMSMSPLSLAADRLDLLDFSVSVQSVGVRIYIRRIEEEKRINWKFFIGPFTLFLHLAVLTCSVFLAVVLWLVLSAERLKDTQITLYESTWIILAALCQKGSHMIPSSRSGKIVFLTAYFSCVIIYAGYSATLTSQLSVQTPLKLPFNNLPGLTQAAQSGWRGGPIKGDFTYIFMRKTCPDILIKSENGSNSQQCEILTRAWTKVVEPVDSRLPKNFLEGLRKVLMEKFAFITTMTGARYTISSQMTDKEACSIYEMQDEPLSSHLAFALKKNLSFKTLLNNKLIRLYQSGTLGRLRHRWLPKLKNCAPPRTEPTKDATLFDVATAPIFFILGLCLSGLVLGTELFSWWWACQNSRVSLSSSSQPHHRHSDPRSTTITSIYNSTPLLLVQPRYEYYWKGFLSDGQ